MQMDIKMEMIVPAIQCILRQPIDAGNVVHILTLSFNVTPNARRVNKSVTIPIISGIIKNSTSKRESKMNLAKVAYPSHITPS